MHGSTLVYIYITRVDPCIKCTRSKLDTGQGVLGLVAPEDLLSVCCLVLPLVLSSVALSPLVSSCLGFSALVSSCVVCWASPRPFLGLSRGSLGTHFGPPKGHFGTPGGPWGFRALLGLFQAAPGQLLGRSWGTLGVPWGHSWWLLGLSWPVPGLLPATLGPSWRLLGPPLGRLGRLLAAESEFSRNLVKTMFFARFLHGFGPSGGLLAPHGPLLAALGWLLGPKWSWVALGWLLSRLKWSCGSWVALGPS